MYCNNKMIYTVQDGDTLYRLAQNYHTTVTELILGNPGVNPYDLQTGMQLHICPGEGYVTAQGERQASCPETEQQTVCDTTQEEPQEKRSGAFQVNMEMTFWKYMYAMSVDAQAKDQQAVEDRLMGAVDAIADAFADVMPPSAVRQMRELLERHVEMTGEIARTLKDGEMHGYDTLLRAWYANADQMAELLGKQDPRLGDRETRNMLLRYLDVNRESLEHRFHGEYAKGIEALDEEIKQVMRMAGHLAGDLMAR